MHLNKEELFSSETMMEEAPTSMDVPEALEDSRSEIERLLTI